MSELQNKPIAQLLPIKGVHKSIINDGKSMYIEEIARPSQSIENVLEAMSYYIRKKD